MRAYIPQQHAKSTVLYLVNNGITFKHSKALLLNNMVLIEVNDSDKKHLIQAHELAQELQEA